MNELETAIFDELVGVEEFEEFFIKICILKSHFNKKELHSLRKVATQQIFLERFTNSIIFINDMITTESVLPFNNITEKERIKGYFDEYEEGD